MTGHTVQRRRVVPVHELIPHFLCDGRVPAPSMRHQYPSEPTARARACVSAPVARPISVRAIIFALLAATSPDCMIISVQRVGAFAVNGGLYGTLLDFSDAIGGFQRQGLHQLDLPVRQYPVSLADRRIADHPEAPRKSAVIPFPTGSLLTLHLQEHFLADHCRPVVQHLRVVDG